MKDGEWSVQIAPQPFPPPMTEWIEYIMIIIKNIIIVIIFTMIVIITVKTDSQAESLIETGRKYYNH